MAAAPLNATELARFRRKISDEAKLAFPDDATLQDLYQEAGGNFTLAVALAFEELSGSATRFAEYTQNQSSEKKQQVFDHLVKMADRYFARYTAEKQSGSQVRIAGMRRGPKPIQEEPRS